MKRRNKSLISLFLDWFYWCLASHDLIHAAHWSQNILTHQLWTLNIKCVLCCDWCWCFPHWAVIQTVYTCCPSMCWYAQDTMKEKNIMYACCRVRDRLWTWMKYICTGGIYKYKRTPVCMFMCVQKHSWVSAFFSCRLESTDFKWTCFYSWTPCVLFCLGLC